MISDVLRDQIAAGQGLHTDFKPDVSNPERLAAVICAFLNTKGGTVFCGVDEHGEVLGLSRDVVTPAQVGRLQRELAAHVTPSALFTVSVDDIEGRAVLTIDVPEGKDRPYVFGGQVLVRSGAHTVAVDAQGLRQMVQTKSVTADRWERRPSMAMDDADLDREEVQALVREAGDSQRHRFAKPEDMDSVLAELGLANARGYTQGADVLFARNPAVRHPQTRVRLIRYASDKTGEAYLDDKQLQGPMVRILQQVFEWVRGQLPLAQRFGAEGEAALARQARLAYPEAALREGLVNAFAHRDYSSFSGGLTVSVFADRIEIWNTGRLPEGLKLADLKRNHPSLPPNPDMAQVLYLRGLMERIGRGTQKIIQACAEQGLRPPLWEDKETGVTLTLWGASHGQDAQASLNARQKALLAVLKVDERVRPAEYRDRFASTVSERQARRDLVALEELGWLRVEGAGAATTYVRTSQT
jgi:ATP-dependent DNA helicase RecG